MAQKSADTRKAFVGSGTVVSEPVYLQLTRICHERLASGDARPGTRFASERELAREFGVSRATAGKVLSNLVAEGCLEHRRGIGMFVSQAKNLRASMREMESFTRHARALGLRPETQVLDFRCMTCPEAPGYAVEALALEPNEKVFYTERLRLADGEPVILERRWIRASLTPRLKRGDLAGSFYTLLEERYGLSPAVERDRIEARNLSALEARKLQTRRGAAALVVEGAGFTENNQGIWYQVLIYRGDRYRLENEMRRHDRNESTQFKRKRAGLAENE